MDPIHFPFRFADLPGIAGVNELPKEGKQFGELFVRTTMSSIIPGAARASASKRTAAASPICRTTSRITARRCQRKRRPSSNTRRRTLVDFVRDCDVLILDTQYDEAEYPKRVNWGHGCIADSVATAVAADVGELVCFHHDPAHSDAKINAKCSRAGGSSRGNPGRGSHMRAAREGEQLILTGKRVAANGLRVVAA